MSFCRWSSDDWACDIYAYESKEGFIIHVAKNRVIGDVPKLGASPENPNDKEACAEWLRAYEAQMEFMRTAKYEDIGLPLDGETYVLDGPDAYRAKMLELRAAGYRFPDYALET